MTLICALRYLQIFSGCVCHLEQRHAQSPFLFPIVFSIISYIYPGLWKSKKLLSKIYVGMKGSATSEGQNNHFFCRTKVFSKRQQHRLSLGSMYAREKWRRYGNQNFVTITTKKYGWSSPKSLSIEIDRWPNKG